MIVERFPQSTPITDGADLLFHQPCVDQGRNLYWLHIYRHAYKFQGIGFYAHEAGNYLVYPVFVGRRSLRHILQDVLSIHLYAHILVEMSLNLVYMVYLLTDVAIKVVLKKLNYDYMTGCRMR